VRGHCGLQLGRHEPDHGLVRGCEIPLAPSTYVSGPFSPQQLNTDLYGVPGIASGVLFHAARPLLSETVFKGGTIYTPLSAQPVSAPGIQAYSVIDNTALFCRGADSPGTAAQFRFQDAIPGSGGVAATTGNGWWLGWNFPNLGFVTAPPGAVGAGITLGNAAGNTFRDVGVVQYGAPSQLNCPWYLDLTPAGGTTTVWYPSFYWITSTEPGVTGNPNDTAGTATRMGYLWQSAASGFGTVSAIPSVTQNWGTVTSANLNAMGSALTFLGNPPTLRVATNSGQPVLNGAITVLDFTSAPPANNGFDNYAGWSTATSTYTVPLPGLYLFAPTTVWGTVSSSGNRWSGLQVHAGGTTASYQGASYQATLVGTGTTGTGFTATATAKVFALQAGDTVAAYGVQSSGVTVPLYTGYFSRLIGAYMTPQAPAGSVLPYTPPVSGFRFQAGALGGTALTAALNSRIGNDVNFLLNRPYFTGFQATANTGFSNNSGFHKITIDTPGALPWGGNGDNYGGWSAGSNWYVSQAAGWYLVIADLYASAPTGTTGTLTAAIYCSSSGGVTPSVSPDLYQQVPYPDANGPPPGAFAMGLYYLQPGEYVYPMLQAQSWSSTWGTTVQGTTAHWVTSQFSAFWVSNLGPLPGGGRG
jgi:hypothetical protein